MAPLSALAGDVSLTVCRLTSCRDDPLPFVYIKRRQGHIWSTYHDILTFVMHGAEGGRGWFSQCSLHKSCSQHRQTPPVFVCTGGWGHFFKERRTGVSHQCLCLFSHQPKWTVLVEKAHQSPVKPDQTAVNWECRPPRHCRLWCLLLVGTVGSLRARSRAALHSELLSLLVLHCCLNMTCCAPSSGLTGLTIFVTLLF